MLTPLWFWDVAPSRRDLEEELQNELAALNPAEVEADVAKIAGLLAARMKRSC